MSGCIFFDPRGHATQQHAFNKARRQLQHTCTGASATACRAAVAAAAASSSADTACRAALTRGSGAATQAGTTGAAAPRANPRCGRSLAAVLLASDGAAGGAAAGAADAPRLMLPLPSAEGAATTCDAARVDAIMLALLALITLLPSASSRAACCASNDASSARSRAFSRARPLPGPLPPPPTHAPAVPASVRGSHTEPRPPATDAAPAAGLPASPPLLGRAGLLILAAPSGTPLPLTPAPAAAAGCCAAACSAATASAACCIAAGNAAMSAGVMGSSMTSAGGTLTCTGTSEGGGRAGSISIAQHRVSWRHWQGCQVRGTAALLPGAPHSLPAARPCSRLRAPAQPAALLPPAARAAGNAAAGG